MAMDLIPYGKAGLITRLSRIYHNRKDEFTKRFSIKTQNTIKVMIYIGLFLVGVLVGKVIL